MKCNVSELRHYQIFPSAKLSEMSEHKLQALRITNMNRFLRERAWWRYEDVIEMDFTNSKGDIQPELAKECAVCQGACCKNMRERNTRIWLTAAEYKKILRLGYSFTRFVPDAFTIDGCTVYLVAVNTDDTCAFLDEGKGCVLGDDRPLWCKLWVCERFHDKLKET